MQSNQKSVDQISTDITLEPARVDLYSVKVQMVLGSLLILLACFAAYGKTLSIGFLLDDFLHLDYVFRAINGDSQDFWQNFYGNWAGSDIMRSYRPLVSLSFFVDALLYGANGVGYHLSNILLLFVCSTLVSLITLEITGLCGNRLGAAAAIWAGLLFAVYPLHPEPVAWIVGRVDLLCVAFFLGSIFCYLRFRNIRERAYLWAALLCFGGSLLSKEMAVVLPVVVLLAELLLWSPLNFKGVRGQTALSNRLVGVMPFWALLGMYMTLRLAVLGTAVGGYTGMSLFDTWRNLLDKFTILKLLVPANEEVPLSAWLKPELLACYAAAAALLIGRLLTRKTMSGPFLWLLLWIVVGVLPAFQIWHVFPNLVGSRMFFLSSAPFCILIALAALPAIDVLAQSSLRLLSGLGLLVLVGIYLPWSLMLSGNLIPWQMAGKQMTALRAQVELLGKQTPTGKRVLLLDLPSDYSGAGMLTRPQYLNFLAMPPLSSQPLAGKLLTMEAPIAGDRAFIWPEKFKQVLNHANLAEVWRFDMKAGEFQVWSKPGGESDYAAVISALSPEAVIFDPPDVTILDAKRWSVRSAATPTVEKQTDSWLVTAGSGLTLWLPPVSIDPTKAVVADINMLVPPEAEGKVQIVWGGKTGSVFKATVQEVKGRQLVWLGRYRNWILNGRVTRIGVRFEPGDYTVKLHGLNIAAYDSLIPKLAVAAASEDPYELWAHQVNKMELAFDYNAQGVVGANAVKLLIGPKNYTFDARNESEVVAPETGTNQQPPITTVMLSGLAGTIALPKAIYQEPGLHQARLVAIDKSGNQVGLPGEPLTFVISASSGR